MEETRNFVHAKNKEGVDGYINTSHVSFIYKEKEDGKDIYVADTVCGRFFVNKCTFYYLAHLINKR